MKAWMVTIDYLDYEFRFFYHSRQFLNYIILTCIFYVFCKYLYLQNDGFKFWRHLTVKDWFGWLIYNNSRFRAAEFLRSDELKLVGGKLLILTLTLSHNIITKKVIVPWRRINHFLFWFRVLPTTKIFKQINISMKERKWCTFYAPDIELQHGGWYSQIWTLNKCYIKYQTIILW